MNVPITRSQLSKKGKQNGSQSLKTKTSPVWLVLSQTREDWAPFC